MLWNFKIWSYKRLTARIKLFLGSKFFSRSHMLGNGRKENLIESLIIYNLTVLGEVFIPSVTNEWNKLPTILLRENNTKAMVRSMNIRLILPCCINNCECVSNTMTLFCFDLGATTISYVNFSNWIYYFIFDSFAIL